MVLTSSPCLAYAWSPTSAPAELVCQVRVDQLWVDYLVLGGARPLPDFRQQLTAGVFVNAIEHNTVAQVLNEHLLEHGERFPVPYLRERADAQLTTTAPSADGRTAR